MASLFSNSPIIKSLSNNSDPMCSCQVWERKGDRAQGAYHLIVKNIISLHIRCSLESLICRNYCDRQVSKVSPVIPASRYSGPCVIPLPCVWAEFSDSLLMLVMNRIQQKWWISYPWLYYRRRSSVLSFYLFTCCHIRRFSRVKPIWQGANCLYRTEASAERSVRKWILPITSWMGLELNPP